MPQTADLSLNLNSNASSTLTSKPVPATSPIKAVLFDAYGTLFDVYSIGALAERLYPGFGVRLAALWRDKQIEYTRLVSSCNGGAHYQGFDVLTRYALRYAIAALKPGLNPDLSTTHTDCEAQLMGQYAHLTAFDDAFLVLQTLKAAGLQTGILSNGTPQMLQVAAASAGLAGQLDHVLSVDDLRTYKTHPQAYALGEAATGVPREQVVFVSSNSWDALGAAWFGYTTVWINRYDMPFETLQRAPNSATLPNFIGKTLTDVLRFPPLQPALHL